jgi:hypothetical protein
VERLVLRRLVLLGTPLALAVLEIFHPQPSGVSDAVEQGGWFMWFHIIQVPLIGLIALAVYLLTEGLEGRAVMVNRWAIGVFAVFFSAYDVAAGIATGYALRAYAPLCSKSTSRLRHALEAASEFEHCLGCPFGVLRVDRPSVSFLCPGVLS